MTRSREPSASPALGFAPGVAAVRGLVAPAVAIAASLGVFWWTWMTWPDAIVDFGRELYVAWRIVEGEVLYRDIAFFNGPLSSYWNAGVFGLFGVNLQALVFANLTIVLVLTVGVARMVQRVTDPFAATLAASTIPLVFAFHSYTRVGNFNWIAPYSHELTHGVALGLLATWLLVHAVEAGRNRSAFASGVVVGLVALTKVEVAAAVCLVAVAALVLRWMPGAPRPTERLCWTAALAVGVVVAPLVATLGMSTAMPLGDAARAAAGSWLYIGDQNVVGLPFFQRSSGMDQPLANFMDSVRWLGLTAAALAPVALLGWAYEQGAKKFAVAIIGVGAAVMGWFWFAWPGEFPALRPPWVPRLDLYWDAIGLRHGARAWPLLLVWLAVALVAHRARAGEKGWQLPDPVYLAPRLLPVVFALGLLPKIILNTRVWHYGFALALPAGVVVVAALAWAIPKWVQKMGGNAAVARSLFAALWAMWVALHLGQTATVIPTKFFWIGEGADAFRTDNRGPVVQSVVSWLGEHTTPDESLTVLPGGEILGYLTRRDNPGRFGNFIPASMALFGEDVMLADLQRAAPDWIALVHRDTSIYGARFFGKDYALAIQAWIDANYDAAILIGAPVFQDSGTMGIEVLRRRAEPNPAD